MTIKAGDIVYIEPDRTTNYLVEVVLDAGTERVMLRDDSGQGFWTSVSAVAHVYERDDGELTDKQLEEVRAASSATDIPAERFTEHLFQQAKEETNEIDKTLSERGNRYGSFASLAQISQDLKGVMHKSTNWGKLTASQKEALEMVQHKIARMLNGDPTYIDNPVDIVGYATLMMKNMQGDLSI